MKYSESHSLFFVHIPKCGGLSIYNGLEHIAAFPWAAFADDLGKPEADIREIVTPFGFEHDSLGPMHQAHIPAQVLKDHFPACWAKLAGAKQSFAILRDPRDRFFSALNQHLREFEKMGASQITESVLQESAKGMCDWLNDHEVIYDLQHIHFARQNEFISADGQQLVGRLFAIENIRDVETWLGSDYQVAPFLQNSRNQSKKPKGKARHLVPLARSGAKLLPRSVRRLVHPLWINSKLFEKAASAYSQMDLGTDVERFIEQRYKEDSALHAAHLKQTPTSVQSA